MTSSHPDLLKLLELAVQDEHQMLEAHQQRVQFYSSLISAILAATVAGAMQAKEHIHYLLLLAGPILVVALSVIAFGGTFRLYQRFLEAQVKKAKIEQALNLHKPVQDDSQDYWKGEPFVGTRHLVSRREHQSSQDFIRHNCRAGYQRYTILLFSTFIAIAICLAVLLVVASKQLP
ncbi:MAG: hypothetical protein KGJ88_11630 [Verrucomicrobiota bacterium]|nr:hypothetical protein [Verrucomicrobiota bacterium]